MHQNQRPLIGYYLTTSNFRILDIEKIKSVPHIPTSHPFVERLIDLIRQELLDRTFFWNAHDLQNKLDIFQGYYNKKRCHSGIDGLSPLQKSINKSLSLLSLNNYQWKSYCRGLFQLLIAA